MSNEFAAAMRRATELTRAGSLDAAMSAIRQALAGDAAPAASPAASPAAFPGPVAPRQTVAPPAPRRPRRGLGAVVALLKGGPRPAFGRARAKGVAPAIPEGAQWLARTHADAAGRRDYRLYVPAGAGGQPRGLIVMLHGCNQNPEDFAAGARMNATAEAHGLLVAWPEQASGANPAACWRWFEPAHQRRGSGEPAILAGMTAALTAEFALTRERVFVAGLSAGGAMAAVLAEAYPELFSAVGVHSGLPVGAASDVASAFAAMRGGAAAGGARRSPPGPRTIVFHGAADATVHPDNGARIAAAAAPAEGAAPRRDRGRTAQGRGWERVTIDANGAPAVEHWLVDGAGHAWSGGDPAGSYTDPAGPDASAEMARFFLAGRAD